MDVRLEEALKLLWLKEEGWNENEIKPIIKYSIKDEDFKILEEKELAKKENGKWVLTGKGRHIASEIIRRMRLAEWLFYEIIEGDESLSNEAACRLEHILTEEAVERICALMGHPRVCPHGRPIPRGKCCGKKKQDVIKPIHLPLTYVKEGEIVKVISMNINDRKILHKLASLGFVPGVKVKVLKEKPLYMIELDENVISLDREIAEKIFVKSLKKKF